MTGFALESPYTGWRPPGELESGAKVSSCGTYRYTLWRSWDRSLPTAVFGMLNPSLADAQVNDPTVRRCVGFAWRWGCGSILIVNMFGYRTPFPSVLAAARAEGVDIHGPDQSEVVQTAMTKAGQNGWPFVVAWGSPGSKALRQLVERGVWAFGLGALANGVKLQCLGVARDGNPRHPLMLPYSAELQPWPVPEVSP